MIKNLSGKLAEFYNIALSTNHGRIFITVLLIKIGVTTITAPELYTHWFIPFVKNFIASGFQNPWDSFLSNNGHNKAFPYGTGMLLIFTAPFSLKALITSISPEIISMGDIFLMRVPILIADLGIFYMLVRSFQLSARKSIYIYWCSPVVFYISYIHGQLDIIPMMIMLASIALLTVNKKYLSSALILGLGLATKENLLVVVPFLMIYIFRKENNLLKVALYLIATSAVYILMIGPIVFSTGYQLMVWGAEERNWIYLTKITLGNYDIFLVPLAMGFLFLKFSLYNKINNDILIMYIGMAFTILLLFIPASTPGWYMWIIPFLCYYYINSQRFHNATLVLFSALFIMFFLTKVPYPLKLIDPNLKSALSEVIGDLTTETQIEKLTNLIFTFLQGIIAYIAIMMYVYGIRSNEIYKERKTPIIIGIGGNSGAGKDTLCNSLKLILGPKNIIQADGDDHHKWERGHQMWKVYTHLNPKANNLFLQFDHTRSLKNGMTVMRRFYNHETGKFSAPKIVEHNKYILASGLHPFYLSNMRKLTDIKIYLDTDEQLRTYWKIKRDVGQRGYTKGQVINSIKMREKDSIKFIEHQKQYTDLIIRYETVNGLSSEEINENSELRVNFTLDNSINIESLVNELEKVPDLKIKHSYEDYDKQYLSVEGRISSEKQHQIATTVIPNLYELADVHMSFEGNLKGIVQLVILCIISYTKLYGKE